MNQDTERERRSFEIATDSGVLAWGDASGVHYAEGHSADTVIAAMHEWGLRCLQHVPDSVRKAHGLSIWFTDKYAGFTGEVEIDPAQTVSL